MLRPIELHVNSRGAKKNRLQAILHQSELYGILPLNGELKTIAFAKGYADGRKHPLQLVDELLSCGEKEALVFSATDFADKLHNATLTGVVPLDKCYILSILEVNRFFFQVCQHCEYLDTDNCFLKDFQCAEAEREKYRDSSWFELKKDKNKERRGSKYGIRT